ncbi:MAG: hypothetical protein IH621_12110 [Krumholzibacteria bacterium]|nr:hypothetical protein [Candidatus Krumholzibacteria bacterium]
MGFTLAAPAQTGRIGVLVGLEAESGCVQFLSETDGTERRCGNPTNCRGFGQSFNMAAGCRTIAVGTDRQGLCTGDLHVGYAQTISRRRDSGISALLKAGRTSRPLA